MKTWPWIEFNDEESLRPDWSGKELGGVVGSSRRKAMLIWLDGNFNALCIVVPFFIFIYSVSESPVGSYSSIFRSGNPDVLDPVSSSFLLILINMPCTISQLRCNSLVTLGQWTKGSKFEPPWYLSVRDDSKWGGEGGAFDPRFAYAFAYNLLISVLSLWQFSRFLIVNFHCLIPSQVWTCSKYGSSSST